MNILSNLFERINSFFKTTSTSSATEQAEVYTDFSTMKVSELRALLKEKGLYSKSLKKKADMINVLESS